MDWDGNVLEDDYYEYEGPVALAGGGGGDQEVQQKADPWSGVQPHLLEAYGAAQDQFRGGGPQYYPGETYVNRDPLENYAQNLSLNYATESLPAQIAQAQGAQAFQLNAPDVANNPYVTGMIDRQQTRLNRNLQENLLPAIGHNAIHAGQMGGSRQGIAEGIAMRGTQEALADAMAQTQLDAYGQGLDAQARGLAFSPQMMQMGLMPMDLIKGAGEYNRATQEQALAADMAEYDFNQNRPEQNVDRYLGRLQGVPWGSTSTTSGGGSGGFSPSGALGGAMLGYSAMPALGGAMAGAAGGMGPSAMLAAGMANPLAVPLLVGGGLLGGLFS